MQETFKNFLGETLIFHRSSFPSHFFPTFGGKTPGNSKPKKSLLTLVDRIYVVFVPRVPLVSFSETNLSFIFYFSPDYRKGFVIPSFLIFLAFDCVSGTSSCLLVLLAEVVALVVIFELGMFVLEDFLCLGFA